MAADVSPPVVEAAPLAAGASPLGNSAYFGQVMLGLLLVLGAIFVIAWLLRRFGQGSLMANNAMKIVASQALGTRERIVMVEVGEQQILLGVAPGRVSTLHVFETAVIPSGKKTGSGQKVVGIHSDFASKIREAMAGRISSKSGAAGNSGADTGDVESRPR